MFCGKCGTEVGDGINYCPKCGSAINPVKKAIETEPKFNYQESGRGTLILILGLLGFVFGPFTGIPAWVMGSGDLSKIKYGIIAVTEKTQTKAGMILGIITTLIVPFLIIIGIAVVVGINVFNTSSAQANRDAVIADLTNLASISQQYYRKPKSMGGGNNSFIGWQIPSQLNSTGNGEYSIEESDAKSISIIGVGNEKGNDLVKKVKVIIKVFPADTSIKIIN